MNNKQLADTLTLIANLLEILEVTVRMPGLTLRRRTEHGGDVVVALDVRLLGEIKVTAIGLRFAGKCRLQIAFGLAALQVHVALLGLVGHTGRLFRQILTPPVTGKRALALCAARPVVDHALRGCETSRPTSRPRRSP